MGPWEAPLLSLAQGRPRPGRPRPGEVPPRKAPPPEGPAHRRLLARRPAPPAPMFPRTRLAALPSLLRALGPAPVAAMRTGTFVVSQPLNYRGGARVEPVDASGTEKAFEPATGNGTGTGGSARVPAKGRAGAWRAGVGAAVQRPGRRPRSPGADWTLGAASRGEDGAAAPGVGISAGDAQRGRENPLLSPREPNQRGRGLLCFGLLRFAGFCEIPVGRKMRMFCTNQNGHPGR